MCAVSTDVADHVFSGMILSDLSKRINDALSLSPSVITKWTGHCELSTYGVDELQPVSDPTSIVQTEDQGQMNSCGGHGGSTAIERVEFLETGRQVQLSRMWVYIRGQQIDGIRGDRGMTISAGVRLLQGQGVCTESTYPYPRSYTTNIPSGASEEAEKRKIGSSVRIRTYDQMQTFLGGNMGAVYGGCQWTSAMANPQNGVVERFRPGRGLGHAWAIVALSPRTDSQGRHYVWLANSHSVRYGNRGFAELSPTCCTEMLQHNFTDLVGLSKLTVPVPRVKINWSRT